MDKRAREIKAVKETGNLLVISDFKAMIAWGKFYVLNQRLILVFFVATCNILAMATFFWVRTVKKRKELLFGPI